MRTVVTVPTAADLAAASADAGCNAVVLHGDVEVRGATHDSRAVGEHDLFVCLRGDRFDGHDFAATAVDAGASALLVDHRLDVDPAVAQIIVEDTRRAAGPIASAVHGRPSEQLATVGVTGTNGKTTVTEMLGTALADIGQTVERIGTLHGARTTPEATDLQALLADFRSVGANAVVMEVSSHALELCRVDGTRFDVVAFTNLGHDHLDLHGTQEAYFRAKARLFDGSFGGVAVINVDDVHGRLLADEASSRADIEVREVTRRDLADIVVAADHHRYRWRGHEVVVRIGGDFNVDNSHLVLEILIALGVDPAAAVTALGADLGIPGRFETIHHPASSAAGFAVVVDYAHTPDGLEELFTTARSIVDGGRVLGVYGCGGDRDREKRPAMGEIGAQLCDLAFFTSDNPRTEDPASIIDDMLRGVGESYRRSVRSTVDRREAIDQALREARSGDLVVIAGRGHETVQDLGDRRIDFDDRDVVRSLLSLLENSS